MDRTVVLVWGLRSARRLIYRSVLYCLVTVQNRPLKANQDQGSLRIAIMHRPAYFTVGGVCQQFGACVGVPFTQNYIQYLGM